MSLVCRECFTDVGPSDVLPGRETTFVYPHLMSQVYLPSAKGEQKFIPAYTSPDENVALCFVCIENNIPDERQPVLKKVYDAFEKETRENRIHMSEADKWVKIGESPWLEAYEELKAALKEIPKSCLVCDKDPKNGLPYFTARMVDKAYSEGPAKNSGTGNYQFSNCKSGQTSFNLCFEDMRSNFPETFELISINILDMKDPKFGQNELTMEKIVLREFAKQKGMSEDQALKELKETMPNTTIIVV